MAYSLTKRETLEECIAKALPNQTEKDVQNLAKTLRDIGAESPDDIQYVEETDLASVLKPVQIRKLLLQVKADLNQENRHIISSSKQIQSSHSAFQEQRFQPQLPSNLSGVCIQIPATNISSSFGVPKISSDELHDPIRTYSEQTPLRKVMCPTSNSFPPVNLNFPRSQINSQCSNVLNYVPVNINQGGSNSDLRRRQFSNRHRPTRPFFIDPIHIERDKPGGVGNPEIVDLSPTEITNFDPPRWNISRNKMLISAPIVVSDDSNSSIVSDSLTSQEYENSVEPPVKESLANDSSVNDSSIANPQTPETSALHSSGNNTLHEDNSNCFEKFKIPWNKMPPALIERFDRHEQPEQKLRWAMIHVVIAEIIKVCPKPTHRNLQQIAQRMVMDYPDSLRNPIENSKNQSGYHSILKQLQARLEMVSRPDRGQFNYQKKLLSYPRTRNSGKFLSNYGCINWQPVKPPCNETKWSLKMKQDILKSISMTSSWDEEKVKADMISTYFYQRKDINSGASIGTLRKDWPFLFEEIGIMVHFKQLTGVDLNLATQEIVNNKIKKFIDFMKSVKLAVVQAEVDSILEEISNEDLMPENRRKKELAAMVPLIMLFLNEDRHLLFPLANPVAMLIPEIPCLLVCGDSIIESSRFSLCIDKEIVNDKITNFFTGVMMLFASYYCFNIHYPDETSGTLEFMQRCLVGINPANRSISKQLSVHPKVVTLLAALTKFDWQVPSELDSYLPLIESGLWTPPTPVNDTEFMPGCSVPNYLPDIPTDESGNNDQIMTESCQDFDSERLSSAPNANNSTEEQPQQSSSSSSSSFDQTSYTAYELDVHPTDQQQSLNTNQHSNEMATNATWDETKFVPGSAAPQKSPRSRKRRFRGKGTASYWARASNGTPGPRSHPHSSAHRQTKDWTKEYWRLKVRETRTKQKPKKNGKRLLKNDAAPASQSNVMNRQDSTDSCSLTLDTSNIPAENRTDSCSLPLEMSNMPVTNERPTEKVSESPVAPPQTAQPSSAIPAALKLSSSSSEILAVPVYKFELQEHSDWLMARFRYLWRMRLLCNAAIGNGSSNIMVHRDVLLATCIKLLEGPNLEIFQGSFLQLTFTSNVKEEALWSLCHFMYEGFLILNANILDNMDNIGYLLGIPNLQHLVARYKKCSLTGLSCKAEKGTPLRIKQELLTAYSEKSGSTFKPFVKMEDTPQRSEKLPDVMQMTQTVDTAVTLSKVMAGGVSTKHPDYTNTLMIVVEVEPNSLPDRISNFVKPAAKGHQQIKHERK